MDSADHGQPPFLIEANNRLRTSDPTKAADTIRARLTEHHSPAHGPGLPADPGHDPPRRHRPNCSCTPAASPNTPARTSWPPTPALPSSPTTPAREPATTADPAATTGGYATSCGCPPFAAIRICPASRTYYDRKRAQGNTTGKPSSPSPVDASTRRRPLGPCPRPQDPPANHRITPTSKITGRRYTARPQLCSQDRPESHGDSTCAPWSAVNRPGPARNPRTSPYPLAGTLGSRALVAQGIEQRFPKPPALSTRQPADLHALRPAIDVYIDRFILVRSATMILRPVSAGDCLAPRPTG